MPNRMAAWVVLFATMIAGCAAANPFRLEDQVALFNDDLRWNRMPAAESQVDAPLRAAFHSRHAAWGRAVRIVDVEIEGTRLNGFTGVALAHFTWLRAQDLDTRETVVETRWRAGFDGSWTLADERVVSGDPALLATR